MTTGCDSLTVHNLTEPDTERVYSTASSIEETIGVQFRNCHNARNQVWIQSGNLALDGLTLFQNTGLEIPRAALPNDPGSQTGFYQDYSAFGTNSRTAANLLAALDRLVAGGGTLGSPARNLRARTFGFFSLACHLGHLALVYDSAAIVTPGLASDFIPALSGATDVMRVAIDMLDSAVAIASMPAASDSGGFPLPATWINGNALTRDEFVRLVRSFRARFRAGVARTPAEREAVNWEAVIDDARNGVSADLMVTTGSTTGWPRVGLLNQVLPPMYYGMADVSGAYDAWLALPPAARGVFLIQTPDNRWPQGATRQAQQASGTAAGASFTATPYLINRTDEVTTQPWLMSYYQYRRVRYLTTVATVGAFPLVTKAEIDLLAAEGYLRRGNIVAAAALIDITRVGRGKLPALTGVITSLTQPVSGGSSCVPRVPAPPAFTSTTCGTIWEAMKWEKRIETAVINYAGWYTDSRGWGDLVEGTALEFPVPYQELSARHKPFHTYGGSLRQSAPRGTYGF